MSSKSDKIRDITLDLFALTDRIYAIDFSPLTEASLRELSDAIRRIRYEQERLVREQNNPLRTIR